MGIVLRKSPAAAALWALVFGAKGLFERAIGESGGPSAWPAFDDAKGNVQYLADPITSD